MASTRLKVAAAVAGSYAALGALVIFLVAWQKITPQLALLMLVALTGLYFGFGVLIAVYRFISRL
jgi:hypothetical protein